MNLTSVPADLTADAPPLRKISYNKVEACRALGIGETTLMDAVRAGKIECVKLGKINLFPAASLDAFLANLPKREGLTRPEKRAA